MECGWLVGYTVEVNSQMQNIEKIMWILDFLFQQSQWQDCTGELSDIFIQEKVSLSRVPVLVGDVKRQRVGDGDEHFMKVIRGSYVWKWIFIEGNRPA